MTPDSEAYIKDMFKVADLFSLWPDLLRRYQQLGFTDPLTDQDRAGEFIYIVKEVRKYIFSHQSEVEAAMGDPYMMRAVLSDMLDNAKEFTTERKKIVYYMIRNEWIVSILNVVNMEIELIEESERS